jgi:hypothetical protein
MSEDLSVWAVEQGGYGCWTTVMIYDNELAATSHAASWDDMVLDHGSEMLPVVQWSVQSRAALVGGGE